jgi:hypothetical protein
MGEGRLIRVSKYRGDPRANSYLIAVADKATAIDSIRSKVASADDEIEDLGQVSAALITAMRLEPGEFLPITGVRHIAQQQQQIQPKTDNPKDE